MDSSRFDWNLSRDRVVVKLQIPIPLMSHSSNADNEARLANEEIASELELNEAHEEADLRAAAAKECRKIFDYEGSDKQVKKAVNEAEISNSRGGYDQ